MPVPEETATLVVKGHYFADWTSVYVQHRWADEFPVFRFSAAERTEKDARWIALQFKPQDECAIYLGGVLAMNGMILTRQVAYDGENHGVQLQGVGKTWAAGRASPITETGNFDGLNFEQLAKQLLAPTGVPVRTVGEMPDNDIVREQIDPGLSNFQNLEQLARSRGIIIGSDHLGHFLLIGQHDYEPVATLTEGVNILKCQAIWSCENARYDIRFTNQSPQTDGHSGPNESQMRVRVPGELKAFSPLLVQASHPVWTVDELKKEAENEAKWTNADNVQVTIVVNGWFRSGGTLWKPGDEVIVNSPMAMLNASSMGNDPQGNATQLKIEQAAFVQSEEEGTITTLLLKAPFGLNGGKKQYDMKPLGALHNMIGGGAPAEATSDMGALTNIPEPPSRPPDLPAEQLSSIISQLTTLE